MATKVKPFNAADYKKSVANKKTETVEVTLPSGWVFEMKRPSKAFLLFGLGQIPQAALSKSIDKWKKVAESGQLKEPLNEADKTLMSKTMSTINQVVELSVNPKLVIGLALEENQLSTDDIDDDDLMFLFNWVISGGVESEKLQTFLGK